MQPACNCSEENSSSKEGGTSSESSVNSEAKRGSKRVKGGTRAKARAAEGEVSVKLMRRRSGLYKNLQEYQNPSAPFPPEKHLHTHDDTISQQHDTRHTTHDTRHTRKP